MQCQPVRDALSALLDGEDPGVDQARIDRHVQSCAACADHADELRTLHRIVRVREAEAVPDLTGAILAAHPAAPAPSWWRAEIGPRRAVEPVSTARWLLFVVGLTQLVLAAPGLLLLPGGDAALHTTRELAAFDAALAIGFLVAAWQPARAWGLLPVAAVLAAVMAGTAVLDVAGGAVSGSGEAHHLLEVVGVIVLWRVARSEPRHQSIPAPAPAH